MLSQIESGKTNPSVNVIYQIAQALNIPFSDLLPMKEIQGRGYKLVSQDMMPVITSKDKKVNSYILSPRDLNQAFEAFFIKIAPCGTHPAEPHGAGQFELVTSIKGPVEVEIGSEAVTLEELETVYFDANLPHSYNNRTDNEVCCHCLVLKKTGE